MGVEMSVLGLSSQAFENAAGRGVRVVGVRGYTSPLHNPRGVLHFASQDGSVTVTATRQVDYFPSRKATIRPGRLQGWLLRHKFARLLGWVTR